MVPVDRVIARRHLVLVVLRMSAGAMLVVGVVTLLYGGLVTVAQAAHFGVRSFVAAGPLAFGISTVIPASALLLLDQRIARWLVPLPRPECPRCGYRLHQSPATCPECGLVLREE